MRKIFRLIPNSFSVSRIIMTIIFISNVLGQFTYRKSDFTNLVVVFLAICLSDLLDGMIARKTGCTSITGAKLDVFADLFYIVLSSIALIVVRILPLWFLGIVCIKFLEFLITSNFINKYSNSSKKIFVFDKIGKIVSAMFFVIPGIACIFQILIPHNAKQLISFLLYIVLIGGIYSSYLRIRSCLKPGFKSSIYVSQISS